MFEMLIFLVIVFTIGGMPFVGIRHVQRRRLLSAWMGDEREERDRLRQQEEEKFIEAQRRYFSSHGIKIAFRQTTPRTADTGAIHLVRMLNWKDNGSQHLTRDCKYGCGQVIMEMHEIAPTTIDGKGVSWVEIGSYCAKCGALDHLDDWKLHHSMHGPLGRRLKGATNLFDVLGDPSVEPTELDWTRLESEESELEAKLIDLRIRRRALAETLGKPLHGGPMRPELPAKNRT